MNIIYLSSVCSQYKFDKLVAEKKITKMPQAQKYHHLLLEGLRKNTKDDIFVISSYPIVGGNKKYYSEEKEIESDILYIYPAFFKFPFIRQIMLWINTIKLILKLLKKGDSIIVCDVLNYSVCYAARFVRFFTKVKIVGIVTDVPGISSGARIKTLPLWKQKFRKGVSRITKNTIYCYDGYLFLTEAMNNVVNIHKKPYIVIEGHSDILMKNRDNNILNKYKKKTLMYAGGTHSEFGIKMLVDAFLAIDNKEWELHIYGDGNYQKKLIEISKQYSNVKYFGLRPNSEIIEAQLKSWILVNPRLTNAEYVKYSFPSKTLECMASGTPLLTTKLAGMPKDYYPYVYLFLNESLDGFKKTLINIFDLSAEELHKKGMLAKDYALTYKNNVVQAKAFYSFLLSL